MHGRVLRIFGQVLLMLVVAAAVGQAPLVRASENPRPTKDGTGHPQQQSTGATSGSGEPVASVNKADDPQIADMRADLQRIRVLINQMQMNLAFVQNTNTPLKHQFELEIEMWQILTKQMERRLDNVGGKENPR